jgi:hypothetical protein
MQVLLTCRLMETAVNWRRMKFFLRHFINGVKYGYPLCCIINFCIDSIVGLPSGISRGVRHRLGGYVPCRLHTRILRPLGKAECMRLMESGFGIETLGPNDLVEIRVNDRTVFATRIPVGLDGILQYHMVLRGKNHS